MQTSRYPRHNHSLPLLPLLPRCHFNFMYLIVYLPPLPLVLAALHSHFRRLNCTKFEHSPYLSACNASSNNSVPQRRRRHGRTVSRLAPYQSDWNVRGVNLCRWIAVDIRRTIRWLLGFAWRSSCTVVCWLPVYSPFFPFNKSHPDADIPPSILVSHGCQALSKFHPCTDINFLTGVRTQCWNDQESFNWSSSRFLLISHCTFKWLFSTARKLAHGSRSTPWNSYMSHKANDASSRYG